MAWNEPGNNDKDKDPWGGGKRNNDRPPDIDEAIQKLIAKISSLFGGKGNSGGGGPSFGDNGGSGKFIFSVAAIFLVGIYLYAGSGIVNEQERAVVLRLGKYHTTKGPGFRWNPPLIDQVSTHNVTQVQQYPLSQQMLTKDLNIVDVDISAQYVIADAKDYVLNVRDPVQSLRHAANSALRHVAGSTPMHEILTEGREQVAAEIKKRLQLYLDNYKTGIQIETVNVEESKPPREVQGAFDDVIKAREDEERFKNEAQTYSNKVVPLARGNAERVKEEARAYKERVIEKAEGEAKRFEYLLTEYKKAPDVTRERMYIDTVQDVMSQSSKVLVDVEGGNNMLYLPLDKIVNTATSTRTTRGSNSSPVNIQSLSDQVIQNLRDRGVVTSSRRGSSNIRGTR